MTRKALYAAALGLAVAACQQETGETGNAANAREAAPKPDGEAATGKSILDGLAGSPDHGKMVEAVKAAGFTETLSGSGPYTLFAPTDAAFAKLPAGALEQLLAPAGKPRLTALLTSHIVPGVVTAQDLARAVDRGKGKAQLATMAGSTLTVTKSGEALVVADASGGQARIAGPGSIQSNGAVHVLDAALLPK